MELSLSLTWRADTAKPHQHLRGRVMEGADRELVTPLSESNTNVAY